jgi:drug/metabolite transporter (DMT)-like permease
MLGRNSNGLVLSAFLLVVLFTGFNALAVKSSESELPAFFGAALRFSIAALLLFLLVVVLHLPLPRGRTLISAVLFGLLASGISRALLYYALEQLPSGIAMVLLGLVPLLTLLFACLHKQEAFHWKSLAGSLVALVGIGAIMRDHIAIHVPLLPVLEVIAAAACFAEGTVIIKGASQSHPITTNAIALTSGSIFLFILSALSKETPRLPTLGATWASLLYLILFGTIATFVLTIYVINHWTASASSYEYVLFPIVAVCIGAWMAHEAVSIDYVIGCALILSGVYIGSMLKLTHVKSLYTGILKRRKAPSQIAEG